MEKREGYRDLGVIPPDGQVALFGQRLVIVHPNGPPFTIDTVTGQREMIEMRGDQMVIHTVGDGPTTGTITAVLAE